MTPDIDNLIEECITNLCDDNVRRGGESLEELARYWAKAGLTLKSFMDMRTYIVNQAIEKTDAIFIKEKLELAEECLRIKRTGSIIITTH